MDKNDFINFINDEIADCERDLRNYQIEIQRYEQIMCLCLNAYLKSFFWFKFFLSVALNGIFKDIRLDYVAFQKAKRNYEISNKCKKIIEDLAICVNNSRKLELITRKNYAELVMIRDENYNINLFGTFMYRNMKRFESLFDISDTLDSLFEDK